MIPPEETPSQKTSSQIGSEDEVHAGYDLEAGILARVREWTDVFPWLRLGRTLRAAGSPPLLMLVAVTFAIWSAGASQITPVLHQYDQASMTVLASDGQPTEIELPRASLLQRLAWTLKDRVLLSAPVALLSQNEPRLSVWRYLAAIAWSLFVWMPVTLLLVRQGALLTAGRPMVGFVVAVKSAIRRCLAAWLMSLVPLACVCAIGFVLLVAGWASQLGQWIETPVSWVAALIAIVCGVLAFGSYFAVPIGWAALVNEKEPDVLDSLSRGYEYLYRRPLQLVMYCLISAVVLLVVVFFAEGVSNAGSNVSTAMMVLAGATESVIASTAETLRLFPMIVAMTLAWALVGGVYLLLRRDAGGQEVEDIWLPTPPPTKPLPRLPSNS